MVAAASDSATFDGSVSIAALWAALPDLPNASAVTGDERRPLYLETVRRADDDRQWFELLVPRLARIGYPRPPELGALITEQPNEDAEVEATRAALGHYPTAAGAIVEFADVVTAYGRERAVVVSFPDEGGQPRAVWDVADRLPQSTGGTASAWNRYAMRPRQGEGEGVPPSQLMTLWALVYGLSQLARYHPALWVEALNPDRSEIAVDLEHVLDVALDLVPDLLVPAVSNGAMPRLIRERAAAEAERQLRQEEADSQEHAARD